MHIPEDTKREQKDVTGKQHESAATDSPGLMQLAVCVLGIYASLYVRVVEGTMRINEG